MAWHSLECVDIGTPICLREFGSDRNSVTSTHIFDYFVCGHIVAYFEMMALEKLPPDCSDYTVLWMVVLYLVCFTCTFTVKNIV